MTRRFAEDTKVPVDRSTAETKKLMRAAGADQVAIVEGADRSLVLFVMRGRQYRLTVPIPQKGNTAQEERRAWRLLLLLVKAKIEAVREGASTIEREFMADVVMPNGQTMAEYAEPQLQLAYSTGEMPKQLLLGGPS